jgi:hypothetical protein
VSHDQLRTEYHMQRPELPPEVEQHLRNIVEERLPEV